MLANISTLATCRPGGSQADLHSITDAALVWEGDTIEWVGPEADVPDAYRGIELVDAGRRLVVPGLVDCHTHLAFGGWREDEFEMRSLGTTYQEIARTDGGILKTVRHTRAASEDELLHRAEQFVWEMIRLGITTVECKSGYGLSVEHELMMLRVYQRLQERVPVEVVPTLLAAHTVPPEHVKTRYVDLICNKIIPAAASDRLAEYCDVFVEDGAFSADEARRILEAGREHGLQPKLHADQLSDSGGASLAAEVGAVSADHLENASEEGISKMASRGVVAVNLPIATLYLRQTPMKARRFLDAGVSVAVATDFNPGSAPSYHLPLAMTLACIQSGMTPAEALKGATLAAARAVSRSQRIGSLEPGKRADFILIDAPSVNQWLYHVRPNAVAATYASGREIYADAEPNKSLSIRRPDS